MSYCFSKRITPSVMLIQSIKKYLQNFHEIKNLFSPIYQIKYASKMCDCNTHALHLENADF